jgi:hypothetical protein
MGEYCEKSAHELITIPILNFDVPILDIKEMSNMPSSPIDIIRNSNFKHMARY